MVILRYLISLAASLIGTKYNMLIKTLMFENGIGLGSLWLLCLQCHESWLKGKIT